MHTQDPTLVRKPCQFWEAHNPVDTLELPGHLPCLALSWRLGHCASHTEAQAAEGDVRGAGAPVRGLREPPGRSSPPQQFSCPLRPPVEKLAQTQRGRLPTASPPEPSPAVAARLQGRWGGGRKKRSQGTKSSQGGATERSSMWALTFERLYGPHVGVIRQKREAGRP